MVSVIINGQRNQPHSCSYSLLRPTLALNGPTIQSPLHHITTPTAPESYWDNYSQLALYFSYRKIWGVPSSPNLVNRELIEIRS